MFVIAIGKTNKRSAQRFPESDLLLKSLEVASTFQTTGQRAPPSFSLFLTRHWRHDGSCRLVIVLRQFFLFKGKLTASRKPFPGAVSICTSPLKMLRRLLIFLRPMPPTTSLSVSAPPPSSAITMLNLASVEQRRMLTKPAPAYFTILVHCSCAIRYTASF